MRRRPPRKRRRPPARPWSKKNPRPRRRRRTERSMDRSSRVFYAALLVLSLVGLGWGMRAAGAMGVAFAFFSVLTLGGSLVCIFERSVVRSAFSLMATFSGVAGLFLLLGDD